MKQTFFVLTIFGMLISCNCFGNPSVASLTGTVTQRIDTTNNKLERQILIEQLKKVQKILNSNDKEKIADIFPFPISNTDFSIYIDDNKFNEQLKANGNLTTKAMFLQYFQQIYTAIQMDQLNNLFESIKPDSLSYKDTLEHVNYIKTEPCYITYKIGILKNIVKVEIDMNSNIDYKNKARSEDEIAENDSAICEHMFWWIFEFDGKKLNLVNIGGAD